MAKTFICKVPADYEAAVLDFRRLGINRLAAQANYPAQLKSSILSKKSSYLSYSNSRRNFRLHTKVQEIKNAGGIRHSGKTRPMTGSLKKSLRPFLIRVRIGSLGILSVQAQCNMI
jgi:hypothetical protein